jgi:hypothetical protein
MLKINTIRIVIFMLISMVFLVFNPISFVKEPMPEQPFSPEEVILTPSEDVSATILTDEYIMPAAELKTTKTYPDIIMIENKYIKISAIPNRGRLIFDYLFKPTGNSELYRNAKPYSVKTATDYVVEFGGYYLSLPWNPRDRQPYDLEYKLIKEGPDIVEVYMWGEDPMNLAFVEVWVIVEKDSSLVQLKTRISNKTEEDMNIVLKDYAVVAPGGGITDNSSFIIPTSEVTIEQSKDNWMGVRGDIISWPPTWSKWGSFEHFGSFNIQTDKMMGPFVAINNHDTGDTLVKLWEPTDFFDGINVWSWGKDYTDIKGAKPTANFENYTGDISIPLGESVDLITYFYTLKDLQNITMANSIFAGWLETDKEVYKAGEDQSFEIQSQVGSSKDDKDLSLKVFITDLDNGIQTQIIAEQVTAISPTELQRKSWKVDLKDMKVEPGEYIFKLELSDISDMVVFAIESPPILIIK